MFGIINYGYINGKKHNLFELIKLKKNKQLSPTTFIYKEESDNSPKLTLCMGEIVKPYLRHMCSKEKDNGSKMGDWHIEWQSHFSDYVEKTYKINNSLKSGSRRSDVDLNENTIVEFQHSSINFENVTNRKEDWGSIGKQIIWVLDGNNCSTVTNISENRSFIEFNNCWLFNSFIGYEFIYIDINEQIYTIEPNMVKCKMIEVNKPFNKKEFIENLKNNNLHMNVLKPPTQTTIYIKQQGAGNGKTFGVIQLLNDINFKHYSTYIYLTKQHSAKDVIMFEFRNHLNEGLLPNLTILEKNITKSNKKHIITFTNNITNKQCKIIIATFDSFIYSLGNKNIKGVDKFKLLVESVINDELRCNNNTGQLNFETSIKLNKELLLVGDEIQDLDESYMKAIIKIIRNTYIDFYAVGDKLQSISIEKNAFSFLYDNDLESNIINILKYPVTNICRRFTHPKLVEFVNNMIPFDKYNLKPIQPFTNHLNTDDNKSPLTFIESKCNIYNPKKETIDEIIKHYKNEVENNNRAPNDFLIVTPVAKNNPLVDHLHCEIREYWKNKIGTDKYTEYSVFHKSVDGTSINLEESEHATRIVSIHSSKGDGRKVVFLVGLNQFNIMHYCNKSGDLIYNSLIHVGLTRMKEQLYVIYEANGDEIHNLIRNNINDIKPYFKFNNNVKIKMIKYNKELYNKCTLLLEENKFKNLSDTINNEKQIIDMKHHNIRYYMFYVIFGLNILNKKDYNQSMYQILKKISNLENETFDNAKDYRSSIYIKNDSIKKHEDLLKFPVLKLNSDKIKKIINIKNSDINEYDKYYQIINNLINKIKEKIQKMLINDGEKIKLKVLEVVVLFHMIDIFENKSFATLQINDLYDIVNIFETEEETNFVKYERSHYDKIELIDNLCNLLSIKYPNLTYLISYPITYKGTNDFKCMDSHNYIGYNKTHVVIIELKPQFNDMNYYETLLKSLINTFIIQYSRKNSNYFENKKIITCILSFDEPTPYYIDWSNNEYKENLIIKYKDLLVNILKEHIFSHFKLKNDSVYAYYKYELYLHNLITNPVDKINKIYDNYKELEENNKNKFPEYINTFMVTMVSKIEDEESNEQANQLLIEYTKQDYFMNKLEFLLIKSINRYLGLNK